MDSPSSVIGERVTIHSPYDPDGSKKEWQWVRILPPNPFKEYDSCFHPDRPPTATALTRARKFCSAATTLTSCSLPAARGTRATTCTFPSSAYKNEWLTYILPQRNHRLERHRPRPAQPRLVVGERRGARHAVERRNRRRRTCNVPS